MTPIEFKEKVQLIIEGTGERRRSWVADPEMGHSYYDDLMEEVLRGLGYGEGIDLTKDMTKWCA